jgi:hypothetical protein
MIYKMDMSSNMTVTVRKLLTQQFQESASTLLATAARFTAKMLSVNYSPLSVKWR